MRPVALSFWDCISHFHSAFRCLWIHHACFATCCIAHCMLFRASLWMTSANSVSSSTTWTISLSPWRCTPTHRSQSPRVGLAALRSAFLWSTAVFCSYCQLYILFFPHQGEHILRFTVLFLHCDWIAWDDPLKNNKKVDLFTKWHEGHEHHNCAISYLCYFITNNMR